MGMVGLNSWEVSHLPLILLCAKSLSRVQLFATLWTVAHQAPLSMGFSCHDYWCGLLFPPPGDLPDPGIKLAMQETTCNIGDLGWILGFGRSPREGNGNPLQYSCLETFRDREAWWATVHRVAESRTQLRN